MMQFRVSVKPECLHPCFFDHICLCMLYLGMMMLPKKCSRSVSFNIDKARVLLQDAAGKCSKGFVSRDQVHIIDGQIVINKDTLTVQAQEAGAPRTIVSGLSQTLNNNSYATNRTSSERWLPEETENFYNVSHLLTSLNPSVTCSGASFGCFPAVIASVRTRSIYCIDTN